MAEATSSAGGAIRVLLVDGCTVMRVGLRTILTGAAAAAAAAADVEVVGECGSAGDALELAASLRPAVMVMDLLGGEGAADVGATGFGLIKDLAAHSTATHALVCSAALPAQTIRHLFAIGARGYVRNDDPAPGIIEAVRRVAAGKTYVDPTIAGDLLTHRPAAAKLTGCEVEVLHMIGHGQTTRAIAKALHRSVKTIETYQSRIKRKLELTSTRALAQRAWQMVHNGDFGRAEAASA